MNPLDNLMLSSQTQASSVLVTETPVEDSSPAYITRCAEAIVRIADEFGLENSSAFVAVAACRGDLQDARRFLLGDFKALSQPPLTKAEILEHLR